MSLGFKVAPRTGKTGIASRDLIQDLFRVSTTSPPQIVSSSAAKADPRLHMAAFTEHKTGNSRLESPAIRGAGRPFPWMLARVETVGGCAEESAQEDCGRLVAVHAEPPRREQLFDSARGCLPRVRAFEAAEASLERLAHSRVSEAGRGGRGHFLVPRIGAPYMADGAACAVLHPETKAAVWRGVLFCST